MLADATPTALAPATTRSWRAPAAPTATRGLVGDAGARELWEPIRAERERASHSHVVRPARRPTRRKT